MGRSSTPLKGKSELVPWGQATERHPALEDAALVVCFLVGLDPKHDGQAVLPWQERLCLQKELQVALRGVRS